MKKRNGKTTAAKALITRVLLALILLVAGLGGLNPQPASVSAAAPGVSIWLNEEPLLQAPITTDVSSARSQVYTVKFTEKMNRASVEQRIRVNAKLWEMDLEEWDTTAPIFSFKWSSDQQVAVTAQLSVELKKSPALAEGKTYVVSVEGAKTAAGKTLKNTPEFIAWLQQPEQLWSLNLATGTLTKKSLFTQPYYWMEFLDSEHRYMLLQQSRDISYESEISLDSIYTIYDTQTQKKVRYPNGMYTNYVGNGSIVVDTRGFIYETPAKATTLPPSTTTQNVKVNGYIYGTAFSRDHQKLILVTGKKDTTQALDLLIHPLNGGKDTLLKGAIKSEPMYSELTSERLPIQMIDQGQHLQIITLSSESTEDDPYIYDSYAYDWNSGKITQENVPTKKGSGFYYPSYTSSFDDQFRLYDGAGLYDMTKKQFVFDQFYGYWRSDSADLWYVREEPETNSKSLYTYDAKTGLEVKMYDLPDDVTDIGLNKSGTELWFMSVNGTAE